MYTTIACLSCAIKTCKNSKDGTLDICDYGVAYFNKNGTILTKESLAPLRYISMNLRHELNRKLAAIVAAATEIDETISSDLVDPNNPASRILGTTLIIDQTIQMITGVTEFHPDDTIKDQVSEKKQLSQLVKNYFNIHSIIKNVRDATELNLHILTEENIYITFCADTIEYLVSIMMDNVWKHSIKGTEVEFSVIHKDYNLCDMVVKNMSKPILEDIDIFAKGSKVDKNIEGFGFGLFWANILIDHYNNKVKELSDDPLKLIHKQIIVEENLAKQQFILENVIIKFC